MASGLSDVLRDMADEPVQRKAPPPPPPPASSSSSAKRRASGISSRSTKTPAPAPAQPLVDRENEVYELKEAARRERPAPATRAGSASRSRSSRSTSSRPASTRSSTATRGGTRRNSDSLKLKRMAVPALLAVGALMMVPALWGLAVLMGLDVPRADQPGSARMATAMLACWPIALGLFGGAAVFWNQIRGVSR